MDNADHPLPDRANCPEAFLRGCPHAQAVPVGGGPGRRAGVVHVAAGGLAVPHEVTEVPTTLGPDPRRGCRRGRPGLRLRAGHELLQRDEHPACSRRSAERMRVYAADLPGQPGLSAADRPSDEQLGYSQWVTDLLRWVREHIRRRGPGRRALARRCGRALGATGPRRRRRRAEPGAASSRCGRRATMLAASLPWLLRPATEGSRRLLAYMSGPGHTASEDLVEWMTLVARSCAHDGRTRAAARRDARRLAATRDVTVAVGRGRPVHPAGQARRRVPQTSRRAAGRRARRRAPARRGGAEARRRRRRAGVSS